MHLICESEKIEDYLLELNQVNYTNPSSRCMFVMKYLILGIYKGNG